MWSVQAIVQEVAWMTLHMFVETRQAAAPENRHDRQWQGDGGNINKAQYIKKI